MKKPVEGRFYVQMENETWEDALSVHGSGYRSIEEAVKDTKENEPDKSFLVLDSNGSIVETCGSEVTVLATVETLAEKYHQELTSNPNKILLIRDTDGMLSMLWGTKNGRVALQTHDLWTPVVFPVMKYEEVGLVSRREAFARMEINDMDIREKLGDKVEDFA